MSKPARAHEVFRDKHYDRQLAVTFVNDSGDAENGVVLAVTDANGKTVFCGLSFADAKELARFVTKGKR